MVIVQQPVPVAAEPAPAKKKEKKKAYKPPRKPPLLLRIPLQLLSFVLCLALTVGLLGTVMLADLNHLMSADGIKQMIHAVLIPSYAAPRTVSPAVGAVGVRLDNSFDIGNIDLDDIPDDLFNSEDGLNVDSLIDWIYEEIEKNSNQPLTVTKEQIEEFIAESNVADFVAEKLAGYTEDFINDTEKTEITVDEVMELLEENEELIEEKFDVNITKDVRKNMEATVEKVVEENDLNEIIREQVFVSVENSIDQTMQIAGKSWEDLRPMVQKLCADETLYTALGICAAILLLLCLLNFYNVPAGLTWGAVPCLVVGALVTAPLALLVASPDIFAGIVSEAITGTIASVAGALIPIHGSVLVLGLALLVLSIFWRIIRAAVRRHRRRAAEA